MCKRVSKICRAIKKHYYREGQKNRFWEVEKIGSGGVEKMGRGVKNKLGELKKIDGPIKNKRGGKIK